MKPTPLQFHRPVRWTILGSSALIALVLGTAVYLFDRDWSTVRFLAPLSARQPGVGGWFGSLGNTLPSFLHAYAFALLMILALRPYRHAATVGALGWFTVAETLELLQIDSFRQFCDGVAGSLSNLVWINGAGTCLVSGIFDTGDLWATALGCSAAWAASRFTESRR
jgi:hypothetical protein